MVRKALHTVLKVCFGHGPIVKYFFIFLDWAAVFDHLSHLWHSTTDFVWEGNAGTRRWAPRGLWSYQRPGHKADWRGHTGRDAVQQGEADRVGMGRGEGAGIVGPLHTRRRGFVLPGDPCCAGQACQGQITDAGGWMYVRTKWQQNNNTGAVVWAQRGEKVCFAHCFLGCISCFYGDALFKTCPSTPSVFESSFS